MGRHEAILAAIFHEPTLSNILWRDIESLLENRGAVVTEGRGSRVNVVLNGVKAVFHRPHPRKEADKGCVVSVRAFLESAGVIP